MPAEHVRCRCGDVVICSAAVGSPGPSPQDVDYKLGQAGLRLPAGETELVLNTSLQYAPNWLVTSVQDAVAAMVAAGRAVLLEPGEIPVGRLAVVADPWATTS